MLKDPVAKIIVKVDRKDVPWLLFSIKRAKSPEKHGKLEFLGGHLEPGETPLQALVRELEEEEKSGLLSRKAAEEQPGFIEFEAGGAHHYLFEIVISENDYQIIEHDKRESLGFELIPASEAVHHRQRLTPRSRKIFNVLSS